MRKSEFSSWATGTVTFVLVQLIVSMLILLRYVRGDGVSLLLYEVCKVMPALAGGFVAGRLTANHGFAAGAPAAASGALFGSLFTVAVQMARGDATGDSLLLLMLGGALRDTLLGGVAGMAGVGSVVAKRPFLNISRRKA